MTRLIPGAITLAAVVGLTGALVAQTKSITKEERTATATIVSIDPATRTLTLKKSDGDHVQLQAPQDVKRFSELKVGDTISARYYENVVLMVRRPGDPAVDRPVGTTTTPAEKGLGGTAAKQRSITATIDAIDTAAPSISFTGPNGWRYTSKVENVQLLKQVKVGDKVEIVWTEALLVSVDTPQSKPQAK